MPNWCYNTLSTSVSESFNLDDNPELFGISNELYIENFVNECSDLGIARDNDYDFSGDFSFYSGWGPPTDLLKEATSKFKHIIIRNEYEEPGMDFAGYYEMQNGEILEQDEWDISEKNWEENGGSRCVDDVMQIIYEKDTLNQKTLFDILQFLNSGEYDNKLEFIWDSIYDEINDYSYESDLENCEDQIKEEFENFIEIKYNLFSEIYNKKVNSKLLNLSIQYNLPNEIQNKIKQLII
jgi:hypothetical protein